MSPASWKFLSRFRTRLPGILFSSKNIYKLSIEYISTYKELYYLEVENETNLVFWENFISE